MSSRGKVPQRKLDYARKFNAYLDKYNQILTIGVDNVGSKKIATTRKELRARDIHILMGKNTIIRKCLRDRRDRYEETNPKAAAQAESMLQMVEGNCGFVFVPENENIGAMREEIISEKVQTAAKAGVLAPVNVSVPAGPTGQDPSQTAFFQTMDIPTKINRGQVEITEEVIIVTKGEKVSRSAAELLVMLNIKPFYYGLSVNWVYSKGDVYPAAVLDIKPSDIAASFNKAVREVAALCLALNMPTAASVPHSIMDAYKSMLAVGLGLKTYSWENLVKVKEILADPSKFMSAGPAAASGGDAKPAEEAKAEEEEEEEESSAAAGGLFGGSGSDSDDDDDDDDSDSS